MLILAWDDEKEIADIQRFRNKLMLRHARILKIIAPKSNWMYRFQSRIEDIVPTFNKKNQSVNKTHFIRHLWRSAFGTISSRVLYYFLAILIFGYIRYLTTSETNDRIRDINFNGKRLDSLMQIMKKSSDSFQDKTIKLK